MPRKTLVVANWKMHFNVHQASLLLHKLQEKIAVHQDVDIVLAPTYLCLQPLSLQIDRHKFKLAAQNCYWRDEGAYTGEVSATQLHGLVDYVIVGHSERRHIFGEHDAEVRHKVAAVLRNQMTPILCVGETAGERAAKETNPVLHAQVTAGLSNVTADEIEKIVIAYEPVWAIGTGNNATPNDTDKAIKYIRQQIASLYGDNAAKAVKILYGGSVDAHNATAYLDLKSVDGFLVGGASLNAEVFSTIVQKAHDHQNNKKEISA